MTTKYTVKLDPRDYEGGNWYAIHDNVGNEIAHGICEASVARLIAAAPELLEAASALLSLNRTQGVADDVYEAAEHALDAAIVKAEGLA